MWIVRNNAQSKQLQIPPELKNILVEQTWDNWSLSSLKEDQKVPFRKALKT